ncbi:MAG: hypothetical protein O7E54_01445 [Planctomycetota bacterium]|nr:hypothetical protein [Planctomycetota bacterium]
MSRTPPFTILLALVTTAHAAPEPELLREEVYNYRVVGKLPPGWRRRAGSLAYTYAIDDVPHAHAHVVRERVKGAFDAAKEIARRATRYRFPGAPKEAKGTTASVTWGGRPALRYDFFATVNGVACHRRVTAMFSGSIWYELIETIYGVPDDRCKQGLAVLLNGFQILTPPLPKGATRDAAKKILRDDRYGYELLKPRGFLRVAVNPAIDPGCRVSFQRAGPHGVRHARVRLFEYATRTRIAPEKWFDIFYGSFASRHKEARREQIKPPAKGIRGARTVWAEQWSGDRDKHAIRTIVLLVWAKSGRVFVLRIRTQADAAEAFADDLARVTQSLKVS